MYKEKIRSEFVEAMDGIMDKIFFDVRMMATVDILTWDESAQIIKDAVDNAYLKFKNMDTTEYATQVLEEMAGGFRDSND